MSTDTRYIIGIDTGGTFTDITVLTDDGQVWIDKAPTTPLDFSAGVMDAVSRIAEVIGISRRNLLGNCAMFKHGTTVATNALITRDGARTGLITTRGFEDTTLIMRAIGRVAGLSEDEIKHQAACTKPKPIVPKRLIKGITERVDFRGNVVIPINLDEARTAIRYLVEEQKVEAIAINLLFSFVNPVHERRMKELVAEMYGSFSSATGNEKDGAGTNISFTYASDLVPVVREYARSNTVIIDSFLKRRVQDYMQALSQKLLEAGYQGPLLLMQSNGGIVSKEEATAVGTLQSGPCGGMIASKYIADRLGHTEVITTDMGGTSFDVGLIVDGYWRYRREPIVERFHITWPMIDIESIGAGGGTIAWIDPVTNGLRLGPKSAAARPGPACYDAGGTEPTITDANVVLGFIDPEYFLGGRMKLDRAQAEEAIGEKIARPLGLSLTEAAAGIYDLINSNMSDLIRKQVVTSGHPPEEFAIYAFGGAGPVHAVAYGADLGVKTIYVFPTSAVFSSFGVAAADIIHTFTISQRSNMPADPDELNGRLEEIEARLASVMEREGVPRQAVAFRRTFYMRYRRQLNELEMPVPAKRYDAGDILGIMSEFDKRYEEVYGAGSAYSQAGTELISISIDAIGQTTKPTLRAQETPDTTVSSEALKGRRRAYFTSARDFLPTGVYDYARLRPGNRIAGPAIVETPITTIVIPPEYHGAVDRYLNIAISAG